VYRRQKDERLMLGRLSDVLRTRAAVQGLSDEPSDLGVAELVCVPEFSQSPQGHTGRTYLPPR
jgi:hypothetical protein